MPLSESPTCPFLFSSWFVVTWYCFLVCRVSLMECWALCMNDIEALSEASSFRSSNLLRADIWLIGRSSRRSHGSTGSDVSLFPKYLVSGCLPGPVFLAGPWTPSLPSTLRNCQNLFLVSKPSARFFLLGHLQCLGKGFEGKLDAEFQCLFFPYLDPWPPKYCLTWLLSHVFSRFVSCLVIVLDSQVEFSRIPATPP